MLRTGLTWKQNQFFGTTTRRIDICDEFKPRLFQLAQPKVRHFDLIAFLRCKDDSGPCEIVQSALACRIEFFSGNHGVKGST